MAVINNVLNAVSDRVTVVMPPISGVTELLYFEDVTIGETPDRYLRREFRYAVDEGLFYTDWVEYTSLSPIFVSFSNVPKIAWVETRYTRAGSDTTGAITFQSCNLYATFFGMPALDMPITQNSIIGDYVGYTRPYLQLIKNILSKFFKRGVLPEYMDRGKTDFPQTDDRDFLDFWKSIISVFSALMLKNDSLRDFTFDDAKLSAHLKEYNHLFSDKNLDLLQLRYIMKNAYSEFVKRGTMSVFEAGEIVNGEFLRLINWLPNDELIVCLYQNERVGWNVGNSSPLYKGSNRNPQNNKVRDFSLSSIMPYYGFPLVTYSEDIVYSKPTIQTTLPTAGFGGLNYYEDGVSDPRTNADGMYLIDEGVDYEVSFWIGANSLGCSFTFIANIFDKDLNWGGAYATNVGGDGVGDSRFTVTIPQPNRYYFVRVFFYNIFRNNYNPITTNLKKGSNFAMYAGSKYILPTFLFYEGGSGADVWLGDLQIHPTVNGVRQTPADGLGCFSISYVNTNNLLSIVCKNKGSYPNKEVYDLTARYLVPHDTKVVINTLNKIIPETNFGYMPEEISGGVFDDTFDESFS